MASNLRTTMAAEANQSQLKKLQDYLCTKRQKSEQQATQLLTEQTTENSNLKKSKFD